MSAQGRLLGRSWSGSAVITRFLRRQSHRASPRQSAPLEVVKTSEYRPTPVAAAHRSFSTEPQSGLLDLKSSRWPPSSPTVSRRPLIYSPYSRQSPSALHTRHFNSVTRLQEEAKPLSPSTKDSPAVVEADSKDEDSIAFAPSERATQMAKVDLSAKLSKEGAPIGRWGAITEVWRLVKIARPEAGQLGLAFSFLLISSSITMAIPFSIGKILDMATSKGGDANLMFGLEPNTFYASLCGVLIIGAAANYGRVLTLRIVGERIVARMRSSLYRRTLMQNAEFFDANRVGDLISRLGSDTIIVGKSITQNLSDGLRAFVSGAAGVTAMAFVSVKLTGILALIAPPVALGAFFYGRFIRNISRKIQKNLGTLTKIAEERLGSVRTTQAFVGERQEVQRYNNQVRKIFNLGLREAYYMSTFYSTTGLTGNLTVLCLLWFGAGMVKSGEISVGDLSSFLMYTAYAGSSMFGMTSFYSELMKGVGAASRLFELQDREPSIYPTNGQSIHSAAGLIEFKNVSFAYPTRPALDIFRDLSFKVQQGTNVAIVAPSGAGKSTVASLLLRYYTPQSGQVFINGMDVSQVNAKQLRRRIGYVGQEPVLFSGTIAENIAYGLPHASRAEIVHAAKEANCNFISDFPLGLETHVGARGTQLSGGQKQRIAIARALLKSPDILILDEATSALDAESETLVNQALTKLLRNQDSTTISIAHRLSTIKRSDRIICFGRDGRVAEEGTFKELSEGQGAFQQLMEWQLSGGEQMVHSRSPGGHEVSEREEIEARLAQELAEHGLDTDHEGEHELEEGAAVEERPNTETSENTKK